MDSRAVLLTIIKNGDASTLDVVNRVKAALPEIRAAAPGMNIDMLFDQVVFVQTAIASVLREGAIAAGLTALMILIFLGSWRSTLIVMISTIQGRTRIISAVSPAAMAPSAQNARYDHLHEDRLIKQHVDIHAGGRPRGFPAARPWARLGPHRGSSIAVL